MQVLMNLPLVDKEYEGCAEKYAEEFSGAVTPDSMWWIEYDRVPAGLGIWEDRNQQARKLKWKCQSIEIIENSDVLQI